jgi:arabinan endo-1,5-alpha-L-arabinosidase
MKSCILAAVVLSVVSPLFALDGQVGIHDPSTAIQCDGKYYVFGTGGSALVSDDGWTWRGGQRASGGGMAPDLIHIGDRYYQYYAANPGGQPHATVTMISTKSLNPESPDYGWENGGIVASTDGIEDCNGIDPSVLLDPNDGKLWLTYGSYFGYIRVVELDPKTGKQLNPPAKFTDISINMEATCMIYRDGWYYLFGTRGSCCRGADSGYNIRMGRSKKPTGPFLDMEGIELIKGGGTLFCASGGRVIGPGHFGLEEEGDGVQKWSMHYEADLDRGGSSVLDIRPLLWKDGWPVAGDNMKEGTYKIESVRTGTTLELAVQGQPVGGGSGRGGGGRGAGGGRGGMPGPGGAQPATPGGAPAGGVMGPTAPDGLRYVAAPGGGDAAGALGGGPAAGGRGGRGGGMGGGVGRGGGGAPVPAQEASLVSMSWPTGNIDTRMANYLCQAQQKWTIAPAPNAGGYLGAPYFKITIAGTDRALAATADAELVTVPAFTGAPEQLWRIEALTDGTWRIMPKVVPGVKEPLALSAIGNSFATLMKFDPKSSKQRWNLKAP